MKKITIVLIVLCLILCMASCGNTQSAAPKETPAVTETPGSAAIVSAPDVLFVGETAPVSVQSTGTVIFSSSDPEVATVDTAGTVCGIREGSATITVALENSPEVRDSIDIVVAEHVSRLYSDQNEITLLADTERSSEVFSVQVEPENAWEKGVTYISTDPSVASVDADGKIVAVSPGVVSITASSLDESCTDVCICVVTVKQGVKAIELNTDDAIIYLDESLALSAVIQPENADDPAVVWKSEDESVALVDETGTVSAVSPGKTVISCEAADGSGVVSRCDVQVAKAVDHISLEQTSETLLVGADAALSSTALTISFTPEDATFRNAIWSSSDEAVATVDDNGLVSAVAPGKAVISAVSADPRAKNQTPVKCNITVGEAVSSLSFGEADDRLQKGSSMRLSLNILPETAMNKTVAWSSSDESVAVVNANGMIRGIGTGKAVITAAATDGSDITAEKEITVFQPVTGVVAKERGQIVIFAGQSKSVHATVQPEDASNKKLTWTSSDPSIASVDQNGSVNGRSQGFVTITAEANDGSGRKASFSFVIEPKVPLTIESTGFGIYNADLLAVEVRNLCTNTAITNYDFELVLYDYTGSKLLTSGYYSIGDDEYIGPGAVREILRTHYGISATYKMSITIAAVKLSDGSFYKIPETARETWSFTRN